MNVAYIVLLILFVIYVPIYLYVRKSEKAHNAGFVTWGPTIMIKTRWGLKMMDRVGKHKRLWNAFGAFSLVVSFLLMVTIIAILVIDISLLPNVIASGTSMGIEYALAIPGLNPMLPLVYGIIGLVIAMVVHELAHGIQSRANDVKVESSGILYGVVPLGAFVEPDEADVEKSSRKAKLHLYAAGITTNFVMAAVLFTVMFASISGFVTTDYDDNPAIYAESYDIGVPVSSIFTMVDGTPIDDYTEFVNYLRVNGTPGLDSYNMTYVYKNETFVKEVALGVYINTLVKDSPVFKSDIPLGSYLLTMSDGTQTVSLEVPEDFTSFMSGTTPGETITVCYQDPNGDVKTVDVVLGEKDGKGFFGASVSLSGMSLTTPTILLDSGINPFYGRESLSDYAMGVIAYIGAPFQGFSPVPESCVWWYDCTIMDADAFWIIIYIIYWTFWLNLVLGVSNALPAVPFDGGFLFRDGVDWLLEKGGMCDVEKRQNLVTVLTNFTSYAMLIAMLLVLVVIVL